MKRLGLSLICLFILSIAVVDVESQRRFDLERERTRLWEWLADRHAELGDEAKRRQLYPQARSEYNRARVLVEDHRNAMRGLGFRQRRGAWVEEDPMPERPELAGEELAEASMAFREHRERVFQRCADRVQQAIDRANRAEDSEAARILASDLLFYDPENAEARRSRGHVRHENDWMPEFVLEWRKAGLDRVERASDGTPVEALDHDEEKIGVTFAKRESTHMRARAGTEERAAELHRLAEATMWRAMDVLGRTEEPFGRGLRFTASHVQRHEFEAILKEVMELDQERLIFVLRLSGHGTRNPWGFMTRAPGPLGATDQLCNTIAVRVMESTREGSGLSQPWISVGFSYMITSQTLGTTSTVRYTLEPRGRTSAGESVEPELTRRSGTPEALREIALNMVTWGSDVPLTELINTGVNDMTQHHAAKSFALMEFFFDRYNREARAWLRMPVAEQAERESEIVDSFGKPLSELEEEWKQWVLEQY
jgi:hypothetical protein